VTLLALLMAAPAFAVNVKLKGDFREFFRYSNRMDLHNEGIDIEAPNPDGSDWATDRRSKDSDFRYSQRLRLTWIMEDDEKKVRGTFGAEFDVTAGQKGGGTRNGPGGNFEGDRTNFELMLAYIDFELPFDPATRVHMGLQGTDMNALVFCDNAMGVKLTRGMGNWNTMLGWYRNDSDDNEGWGGDDRSQYEDLFTLDVGYDFQDGNRIGLFAYYLDAGRDQNWPQSNSQPIPNVYWDDSTQTYWVGAAAQLERGNLFGGFTAIYQGGTARSTDPTFFDGDDDADIKAYLINVEGSVKIDKAYVQLGYFYASGDDDLTDDDVENFTSIDTDNSTLGSVALLEKYDWNAILYGPYVGFLGASHVYLNAGYEFNEKCDGRLGFIWFNTAEDVDGDALWGNGEKDDAIGYEINAQVDYSITENLTAGIAAGYLIGDDAWDALATDGDGDDLWNVISRIRFKF
jgi:hypothetical protein